MDECVRAEEFEPLLFASRNDESPDQGFKARARENGSATTTPNGAPRRSGENVSFSRFCRECEVPAGDVSQAYMMA
ncbi:hypothetical protein MTO96_033822 [Rhipicephalus appendiculatus]